MSMMPGSWKYKTENDREVGTCTECMQVGELNHRGVCDYCDDPYGVSALAMLLELEEAVLREQE